MGLTLNNWFVWKKSNFADRKAIKDERGTQMAGAPERIELAEGPGFEPGLTGPEPVVLPLDDPSVLIDANNYYTNACPSSQI